MARGEAVAKVRIRRALWTWPPRQWPLLLVVGCAIVSLIVVATANFRPGTVMFAGSILLGALFRLVLPARQAGLLVLRTRAIDVVTMTLLGMIILILGIAVPELQGGIPAGTG